MGEVHSRLGLHDVAAADLAAAVDAASSSGSDADLAAILAERALATYRTGDPTAAADIAAHALRIAERSDDAGVLAATTNTLGVIAARQGSAPPPNAGCAPAWSTPTAPAMRPSPSPCSTTWLGCSTRRATRPRLAQRLRKRWRAASGWASPPHRGAAHQPRGPTAGRRRQRDRDAPPEAGGGAVRRGRRRPGTPAGHLEVRRVVTRPPRYTHRTPRPSQDR